MFTNQNRNIELYVKGCSDRVRPGNKNDCDMAGCDFRDSKCFPSSCTNISNQSECSSNYNCLWSPIRNFCAKDNWPSYCKTLESKEKCTNQKKCFWNINKNNNYGDPGVCDTINPKDWKPQI